jgi:hypothetical protein
VDDGNTEVLRVEIEEGNEVLRILWRTNPWRRSCFRYPLLRMKHNKLFEIY